MKIESNDQYTENMMSKVMESIGNISLESDLGNNERIKIINYLLKIAKKTAKRKFDSATSDSVSYVTRAIYRMVGEKTYVFKMEDFLDCLKDMVKITVENELIISTSMIIEAIGVIGEVTSESDWNRFVRYKSIEYLEEIGKSIIEKKWEMPATSVFLGLEKIGKRNLESESNVIIVVKALNDILTSLINLKELTEEIDSTALKRMSEEALNDVQQMKKEINPKYFDILDKINKDNK